MNLTCPKCNHEWDFKGKGNRPTCPKCMSKLPKLDNIKCPKNVQISSDFMSGSLIDALKKTGLDPMKNGQIRDAISSILETDECKIAFADAVEKTRLSPIKLTKKILKDWLKKEEYL